MVLPPGARNEELGRARASARGFYRVVPMAVALGLTQGRRGSSAGFGARLQPCDGRCVGSDGRGVVE